MELTDNFSDGLKLQLSLGRADLSDGRITSREFREFFDAHIESRDFIVKPDPYTAIYRTVYLER